MPGLYIHIPFCEHKCIYCDFYSVAPGTSRADFAASQTRFVDSLLREFRLRAAEYDRQTEYDTIFFGGGTPSLLPAETLERILKELAALFPVAAGVEITLEANPGTVDRPALDALRKAGFNRISFGIQSFFDDDLKSLSRIHTSGQAIRCVRDASDAGFDNLSFDLIFSLPGQTQERWRSNLNTALELGPKHISTYSLIVEPHTPLQAMVDAGQVAPIGEEADARLYECTIETLTAAGYEQYEVSNFALPGFRSRHNYNYWRHGMYLGFGPSAHSFAGGKRWWNISSVGRYSEMIESGAFPVVGEEQLSETQLMTETIFLGLRSDGIDLEGFERSYRKALLEYAGPALSRYLKERLLVIEHGRLKLTPKGYLVCDEICAALGA